MYIQLFSAGDGLSGNFTAPSALVQFILVMIHAWTLYRYFCGIFVKDISIVYIDLVTYKAELFSSLFNILK